jgi:hypothetical protein
MEAIYNGKAYTFIGTTDERTTCDCCGRTNLKYTIVLNDNIDDQFVFFGSQCGARALGWTVKDFNNAAKSADKAAKKAAHLRSIEIATLVENHPDVIAARKAIPQIGSMPYAERAPFICAALETAVRISKEIEETYGK